MPETDPDEIEESETRDWTALRLASIGMVASGLAHQIGSPLAAVVANLEVALAVLRDAEGAGAVRPVNLSEVRDALGDAVSAADRITRLLAALSAFARGGLLARSVVKIPDVVAAAVRIAGPSVRARAELVVAIGATPNVSADERLTHALANLMFNAAQSVAMVEGRAVIRIETFTDDRGNAILAVSDTGEGIAASQLPRVFDAATTSPTGIGLWICHRIVEELGGDIAVESELGHGATFRIRLPAADPTNRWESKSCA